MSGIFGNKNSNASQVTKYTGIAIQTSAQGIVIPIVHGKTRIAPNIGWTGNFISHAREVGGGKGGSASSTEYTYSCGAMFLLCEGEIFSSPRSWLNKIAQYIENMAVYAGTSDAIPDSWLAPYSQSIPYRRTAYAIKPDWNLGSTNSLPALSFEIIGSRKVSLEFDAGGYGIDDVRPSESIADLLLNPQYGAGFPVEAIIDEGNYDPYYMPLHFPYFYLYCMSLGLKISPAFTEQKSAAQHITDIVTSMNSAFSFSNGILDIIPYENNHIQGIYGAFEFWHKVPEFDLTDNDFLELPQLIRKKQSDTYNSIRVEYLNRDHDYNPSIVQATDLASALVYGERKKEPIAVHWICLPEVAQRVADRLLIREMVRNVYTFKLDWRYVGLATMDIVTLTDTGLELNKAWVRITDISEDEEGILSFTAEECIIGEDITGPETTSFAEPEDTVLDMMAAADNVDYPWFIETPRELWHNPIVPELWIAVSGDTNWGGCQVWISDDDTTYKMIGKMNMPTRMGNLVADISDGTVITSPESEASMAKVELTTDSQLLSATEDEANMLRTLCYIDGEYVAYEGATLHVARTYWLSGLRRGKYRTAQETHMEGSRFIRMDDNLFKMPFPITDIGHTYYFKFISFNEYGRGQQTLDEVTAYSYEIRGLKQGGIPLVSPNNTQYTFTAHNGGTLDI